MMRIIFALATLAMDTTIVQALLILVTLLGAIAAALLGWAESGQPFDKRKFAASIGRAIIAGLLSSLVFQNQTEIDVWVLVLAFLTGAGLDVIGHRGIGALRTLQQENSGDVEEDN